MSDPAAEDLPGWARFREPWGWTVLDASLAVGFLVLLVTEIVPNPDMTPHAALLALAVLLAAPLPWRSSHAAVVAVLASAAHAAMSVVSTGDFSPQLAVIPVLVTLYSAASRTRGPQALVTGLVTLTLTVASWVATDQGASDDFWPWMLWAGAWTAGTFVRRREDLAAHHAARAQRLETEARTAAAESAQAERDRIARELHDVVAHSVSVMVVQAGAERLRLGGDPAAGRTRAALEAVESSGRLALAELRTMLGVLRDPTPEDLAPVPSIAAIPGLVARVVDAGLPVVLEPTSPELLPGDVDDPVGLAAYRVVQEALTNVLRHAGPVPTRVVLSRDPEGLSVTVSNAAAVLTRPDRGSGRGLAGMRERAEALGGTCTAGPEGEGFAVRVTLPLTTARAEP